MKAVLLPAIFFGALSAQSGLAAPTMSGYQFNCAYKSQVNGNWESRGLVSPFMSSDGLHLRFGPSEAGSGMDQIQTTNTDSEYRVEGRCPGWITLTDSKPFKIRDFAFVVNFAEIGAKEGLVELKLAGWALVNNSDPKDSFDKIWTVRKPELDRFNNETDDSHKTKLDPFKSKYESKTVCGNQLTLRFDDLRGVAIRNQTSQVDEREPTTVDLSELWVTFDPC